MMPIRLSRTRRAFYGILISLLLLGSAEIALRVHDFSFYFNFGADLLGLPLLDLHRIRRIQNRTVDFDPYLFWRFKPNQVLDFAGIYRKPVHINSLGFRGPEFSRQKPAGVYRIVCLGDSTTFGWSVGDDEAYPARLAEFLEKDCGRGRVEVINLGVTGYTSLQGRELMAREVMNFQPDLVIFAFGPNDRLPALKSDREHLENKTWDIGAVQVFLHRFQVYKLMKAGVIYLENLSRGLSLSPVSYLPRLKRKVSPEEFAENVEAVKANCDQLSADLILVHVDFPSLPVDHVDQELRELAKKYHASLSPAWENWNGQTLIAALSQKYHLPALDLRELFEDTISQIVSGERDPDRALLMELSVSERLWSEPWRYLMVDNGHPNEWGHEVIASALREKILLLPRFQKACAQLGKTEEGSRE